MTKTIGAALSIALLLFTASAASAQVCIVGIFAAAISASVRDNRELTEKEAWTCGATYLLEKPAPAKVSKRARHHDAKKDVARQ
jgi:hypothetical protein